MAAPSEKYIVEASTSSLENIENMKRHLIFPLGIIF
jgi:hypothetical protein